MSRLTTDDLRRITLGRQFPAGRVGEPTATDVLDLFSRLGPVQSQVPRAPFLAASSRLPGVSYATVNDLLESHRLLKTTTIRGTVHTSTPGQFVWLDAVAAEYWARQMPRVLGLEAVTADEVTREIERFCADSWRPRADIVSHMRRWLAEHDPEGGGRGEVSTLTDAFLWDTAG